MSTYSTYAARRVTGIFGGKVKISGLRTGYHGDPLTLYKLRMPEYCRINALEVYS